MKGCGGFVLGEEGAEMLLGCSWRNTLERCCVFPFITPSVRPRMLYLLYKEGRRRSFLLLESFILQLLVAFK